jgi:hypothetical protein
MPFIRLPEEHWGEVWGALVATGPIARVSQEPIYFVGEEQVRLLRRKKLPFELLPTPNRPESGTAYASKHPGG